MQSARSFLSKRENDRALCCFRSRSFPPGAELHYDNLVTAANVIHAAHVHRAEKLMFLDSSCIYPKLAPQPIREDAMLTGPQGADAGLFAPHFVCNVHRKFQLRPLLFFGEDVALLRRGEAALR